LEREKTSQENQEKGRPQKENKFQGEKKLKAKGYGSEKSGEAAIIMSQTIFHRRILCAQDVSL